MDAVPTEARTVDVQTALTSAGSRLVETAALLLRPAPPREELLRRLERITDELAAVLDDLLIVHHLERSGEELAARATELEERLTAGWEPSGEPADEISERLRRLVLPH